MMTFEEALGPKVLSDEIVANRRSFLLRSGWTETLGGFSRVRLGRTYLMPESSVRFLPKDDFIFSARFPEKTWV